MVVRDATAEDVPAVLPMVGALCAMHERADPERFKVREDILERYARWLPERACDARSVFLVAAREDSTLAGFAVGTIEPEVPIFWIPECGWIHDLWVEPGDRGRGVGRSLTAGAVERFRAMGVGQVRLHAGVFNRSAREAFERSGFRACVVEMILPLRPTPCGPGGARPADGDGGPPRDR